MDKSKFQHVAQIRVRSYQVDTLGIVHNSIYLQYLEVARIEYLKHLGINISVGQVQKEFNVVLVRNEIDYKSPARFDELLNIYTRVLYIRDTSFAFE